jgi:hypothetical protein
VACFFSFQLAVILILDTDGFNAGEGMTSLHRIGFLRRNIIPP